MAVVCLCARVCACAFVNVCGHVEQATIRALQLVGEGAIGQLKSAHASIGGPMDPKEENSVSACLQACKPAASVPTSLGAACSWGWFLIR